MSLWSQFDKVMGLQLVSFVRSLPAFGISFKKEVLWEIGRLLVSMLYCQAFFRSSPKVDHKSLIMEYGIPSGPGAESEQVPRVFRSSCVDSGEETKSSSSSEMGLMWLKIETKIRWIKNSDAPTLLVKKKGWVQTKKIYKIFFSSS